MAIRVKCQNPNCARPDVAEISELGSIGLCSYCGRLLEMSSETDIDAPETRPGLLTDLSSRNKVSGSLNPFFLEPGQLFAERYQIERKLGHGGMGSVYLVRDIHLDRLFALKIPNLSGADADFIKRFLREARAMAQLIHQKNICKIIFVTSPHDQHIYLTMEYVNGTSLADIIKQQSEPFPIHEAIRIVIDLARALGEAHSLKIIHRDLKPSNVMINEDGVPILMDFGLARREGDEQITTGPIGTLPYMSPEQTRERSDAVGYPTDIYSLGVILYEMLTGVRPFMASMAVILLKIREEPPRPPSELRPGLDPRLEAICLKALAKAPSDRFSSMFEFAEALEALLKPQKSGLTSLVDDPEDWPDKTIIPPEPPKIGPKKSRLPLVATSLALGALLAASYPFWKDRLAAKADPPPEVPSLPPDIGKKPIEVVIPDSTRPSEPPSQVPAIVLVPPGPAPIKEGDREKPVPIVTKLQPVPVTTETAAPGPVPPPPSFDAGGMPGLKLIRVDGGSFTMGDTAGVFRNASKHEVSLSPFYLGETEVSWEVLDRYFQAKSGSRPNNASDDPARNPVNRMSWIEIARFLNWLSEQDHRPIYYAIDGEAVAIPEPSGSGYRFPTEAEFEFVLRRSDPGLDPRKSIVQVDELKADRQGFKGLYGNVWEFCQDWYNPSYEAGPLKDPLGPATGKARVFRGGHSPMIKDELLPYYRGFNLGREADKSVGFRISTYSPPVALRPNTGP